MIFYRRLKAGDDLEQAKDLWAAKGRHIPSGAIGFGAFTDDGAMIGCVFIQQVNLVEGLISDNPLCSHILVEKALACISTISDRAYAMVESGNESWNDQITKSGFVEIGDFKKFVRML